MSSLRTGWSLTGTVNHPASSEATGLEVDKYDGEAVRRYLDHYLALYRDAAGDGLVGARGLTAFLNDSIESGPANWTGRMREQFRARRGYDPLRWIPAMTGTIIGMAHALGETAPLLMIGMVAFIVDVPTSLTDSATALPVQIYLWSDLPEQAFQAKTAAAIIVLLAVLFAMNGTAIWLRKKFERRW